MDKKWYTFIGLNQVHYDNYNTSGLSELCWKQKSA